MADTSVCFIFSVVNLQHLRRASFL